MNQVIFEPSEQRVVALPQSSALEARQSTEVQAAMVMAKRFPRDENESFARIMKACARASLADQSMYAYKRGGQLVTGPSIRLAEVLSRAWGNLEAGVVELARSDGESQVMAFCWDLETNFRVTKTFAVRHERTKNDRGTGTKTRVRLDDDRDVYEMVANQGARRMRACILGVIPGDVVEAAVGRCKETMAGDKREPIQDRARKVAAAFSEYGITVEMIEKRLGHNLDATVDAELVTLRQIFTSLRDGMAKPGDFFDVGTVEKEPSEAGARVKEVAAKAAAKKLTVDQMRTAVRKKFAEDEDALLEFYERHGEEYPQDVGEWTDEQVRAGHGVLFG